MRYAHVGAPGHSVPEGPWRISSRSRTESSSEYKARSASNALRGKRHCLPLGLTPHRYAATVERGTRLELATACLEGRYSTN